MRLPDDGIKQGILHPEHEVRITAVNYWSQSLSPDATVMPLVIQAVERYGRHTAFSILRDAEHLAQSELTINWLVNELRRDYDGHAALSHFCFEAVEPVRMLVLGPDDELSSDHRDLRYRLVATATIMEATFPEYEKRHKAALATNYGWGDHRPGRLADAFPPKDRHEQ